MTIRLQITSLAFSDKRYHLEKNLKIITCPFFFFFAYLNLSSYVDLNSANYIFLLEISTLIFNEQ